MATLQCLKLDIKYVEVIIDLHVLNNCPFSGPQIAFYEQIGLCGPPLNFFYPDVTLKPKLFATPVLNSRWVGVPIIQEATIPIHKMARHELQSIGTVTHFWLSCLRTFGFEIMR